MATAKLRTLMLALLVYLMVSPFLQTGIERYVILFFGALLTFGLAFALAIAVKVAITTGGRWLKNKML